MPRTGSGICFLGMSLFLVGERIRIIRKRGEHGQAEETRQRPEALVHSVIPLRTHRHKP
jgi:hypothetical protein